MLGEEGRGPAAALDALVRRHAALVGVGGRDVDPSALDRPPALLDGKRGEIRRATRPVRPDVETVGDVGDDVDGPGRPVTTRRLQHPRRARVGDEECVVIRPVEVQVSRAALPVRLDERRHHLERLARGAPALEPEPDQIHPRQPDGGERLAREHRLVADRDAMRVHAVLQSPQPVRLRADDGMRLGDLRHLEVLAAQHRSRGVTSGRQRDDALALARRPVAVLREEGHAVARGRCESDQGIAAHRRERARPRHRGQEGPSARHPDGFRLWSRLP